MSAILFLILVIASFVISSLIIAPPYYNIQKTKEDKIAGIFKKVYIIFKHLLTHGGAFTIKKDLKCLSFLNLWKYVFFKIL